MSKELLTSKYKEWFHNQIKKNILQNLELRIYKNIYKNIHIEYGITQRFLTARRIKYLGMISVTSTIVTSFQIKNTKTSLNIIYGFLYTQVLEDQKDKNNNVLNHLYTCHGPSLVSRDGEFRNNFQLFGSFEYIIIHYRDIWEKLEEYILKLISKKEWLLYAEYFYPEQETEKLYNFLEIDILDKKLAIHMLIANWFIETYEIFTKQNTRHINKIFYDIMGFSQTKYLNKYIQFMSSLIKDYNTKIHDIYLNLTQFNINPVNSTSLKLRSSNTKLGQKITPLNLNEVINPFNIRYKPWRELLINIKVQDFIINGICYGFPIVGEYCYIKNARKTLFDNYVQFLRLQQSEIALVIAKKLLEAQNGTLLYEKKNILNENQKKLNKSVVKMNKIINNNEAFKLKNNNEVFKLKSSNDKSVEYKKIEEQTPEEDPESISLNEWISNKFKRLHEKINDPVDYAKNDIIMSEVAFMISYEHVGRTAFDILKSIKNNHTIKMNIGNPMNDIITWNKYIFELIYNLYCLNKHAGVIHADLHMNNWTIGSSYTSDYKNIQDLKSPTCLYAIEYDEIYGFPTTEYRTHIIDFSRSIIQPEKIQIFKNFNILNAEKSKYNKLLYTDGQIQLLDEKDDEIFNKEQTLRVLWLYEQFFPGFLQKNRSELTVLLLKKLNILFPIFTAFDIYKFSTDLINFIKKEYHLSTQHLKLMNNIKDSCEYYLLDVVQKIIDEPNLSNKSYEMSTLLILREHFSQYIVYNKNTDKITNSHLDIIDISCAFNKLEYSLSDQNNYPDCIKLMISPDIKDKNFKQIENNVIKNRKIYEESILTQHHKVISLIAHRHRYHIRF
jgi:hypothetical protein